jgi:hypothetical protein
MSLKGEGNGDKNDGRDENVRKRQYTVT